MISTVTLKRCNAPMEHKNVEKGTVPFSTFRKIITNHDNGRQKALTPADFP